MLREEIATLQKKLNDKDVEILTAKLTLNENEGIMCALQLHNEALLERVQLLADRVETLTYESRNVERLKEEFYQHCRDYIEKKKSVQETVSTLKEKFERERNQKLEVEG